MDIVAEFRAEATAFLDAHATRKPRGVAAAWGSGDDNIGLLDPHPDRATAAEQLERSPEWRRLVFDAGFGWLGGPVEPILDEEHRLLERQYAVPDQQPFATARADEVAHAVRFLLDDQAAFVTGSIVTVDGGLSM